MSTPAPGAGAEATECGPRALPAELRGDDVLLRPWSLEDASWYAACSRDPEVQRFTTDPPDLTADDVADAISALLQQADRAGYLIADARSGRRLGTIALDHADGIGEVSYWVAAASRGHGVASSALQQLADAAFAYLQLRELRLWTHADNLPSQRVAERSGFRRDPPRDQLRHIKGMAWPTVAYTRPARGGRVGEPDTETRR